MASALLALADAAADQENVDPSIDIIANVRSSARGVRAAHIDGSAKETRKRSRGPRSSDAEKIESLLCFIDGAETAFALADDVIQYLSSIGNLGLAVEALRLVTTTGTHQLNAIRKEVDYTKAKQNATQSHKKLTKVDRQRFGEEQLQRRVLAPANPRKMLQLAISSTKKKLSSCHESSAAVPESGSGITAPRAKQRKLSSATTKVFTIQERKQRIYDSVRLPRPRGGNLVYSVAETVEVIHVLVRQNNKNKTHPARCYLAAVKQKMINEVRVPAKRSQLNQLLKDDGEGKSLPTFWDCRGRPDYMSLGDLRIEFDEHAKRDGNCWTHEQTENALVKRMKAKLTSAGLDLSTINPPNHKTVRAYHSALMPMPDLTTHKCNRKNAL